MNKVKPCIVSITVKKTDGFFSNYQSEIGCSSRLKFRPNHKKQKRGHALAGAEEVQYLTWKRRGTSSIFPRLHTAV